MKKAQITLFMVIGVVLLIILGMVFYIARFGINIKPKNLDISEIENYVEETLRLSAKHCLNKVGMQGGKNRPELYLQQPYSNIEYAYNSRDNFLSYDALKTEIEDCIKETMPLCINDFKEFKRKGYKINHANLNPEIVLAAKDISALTIYDVNVKTKYEERKLGEFKTDKIIVRLNRLHNITNTITDLRASQQRDSDFDMTYLGSIDVDSSIYRESDGQQIYSLADPESSMDNKQYFFLFSNNY